MIFDRRTRLYKRLNLVHLYVSLYRHELLGAVVLGILASCILVGSLRSAPKTSLKPLGQTKPIQIVKVVEAKDWNDDLVGYFRYRGQQLEYNDYQITKLHGIMDCENGLHTANRKNYLYDGENGRYTAAGFAMITKSTFKGNKCAGDRFNGVDNINCMYKIYASRGTQPWNASKACWSKKFTVKGDRV